MFNAEAVVEMPKNTSYKFEIDKKDGKLVLDRPLKVCIPFNYGYLPSTLAADNDPLDIFILSDYSIHPLTTVKVSVQGVLRCLDNGVVDDKLVGVLCGEEDNQIFENALDLIVGYLNTYKSGFEVIEFCGETEAMKIYNESKI